MRIGTNTNHFDCQDLDGNIPVLICGEDYVTSNLFSLHDASGKLLVRLSKAPRLLQRKTILCAKQTSTILRNIPANTWFDIFRRAGHMLLDNYDQHGFNQYKTYIQVLSSVSGIPEVRIVKAWRVLALDLLRMEEIMAAQSPDGTVAPFQSGISGQNWMWMPAGRDVAVRIPANFPTINIAWLQVLAARRSVLLCASLEDPFTPLVFAKLLYEAGLPKGAISLCYEDAPVFWKMADQILWPGSIPENFMTDFGKLYNYHHGQSKFVLLGGYPSQAVLNSVIQHIVRGCGRLCTNVSSIIVEENATIVGEAIAKKLNDYQILPLNHPDCIVPAFVDKNKARTIVSQIERGLELGDVDLTARSELPLYVEQDGNLYLRPTVLLVKHDSPIWGAELPFPFVTITEAAVSQIQDLCRNSLIVWVSGDNSDLVESLILEPTIDKVFQGSHIEREFDPALPHEGFIADFLFRKKTVFVDTQQLGVIT